MGRLLFIFSYIYEDICMQIENSNIMLIWNKNMKKSVLSKIL